MAAGMCAGRSPAAEPDPLGVRYTDGVGLRVRVFGGLAVEGVDLARLSSRKARRLLSRLAVARGKAVGVGALADVI